MGKELICRCEEITKEEIVEAIREGRHSVTSIKRALRAGMGACQGRTCSRLILQLLAEEGVIRREEAQSDKPRFPLTPLRLGSLLTEGEEDA